MRLLKQAGILTIGLLLGISLTAVAQRNAKWAEPVAAVYLKNFYRVDSGVYRAEQPAKEGFAELERMGIKEALNLRSYHSNKDGAKGTGLVLHRVKMKASDSDWDEVVKALRIIKNRKGPIVIHCWHGSDRTGLTVALYRIVFQGWSKQEAIEELKNGGYGYHTVYKNIIDFINELDVEKMKRSVNS